MIVLPGYPVYVPTSGRWQPNRALTRKTLQRDKVPCRWVVKPREVHHYLPYVAEWEHLVVLPHDDFNLLTTRNFIRDHAERFGHARHWQLDDNLIEFRRLWQGRRIPCHAGLALRVCEDLSDRYSNVGVSGLNYQMFVPAESPSHWQNVHVYSCTLVNHAMPCRWRMILNDDTDLCLQALTSGWTTILVNAFMANKLQTMILSGGNTDDLYALGETGTGATDTQGRFDMARVLQRQWPNLVKTTRRFGRWQHAVRWDKFREEPKLKLRKGFDLASLPEVDEYGATLRAVKEVRSPALRQLLEEF